MCVQRPMTWDELVEVIKGLKEENRKLRELLREVALARPTFDDDRLNYVEIQVSKAWIKEALATLDGGQVSRVLAE